MIQGLAGGAFAVDALERDDVAVLPFEHVFVDRTGDDGAGESLEPIALDNVASAKLHPREFMHNLVLESLDDAERELAAFASRAVAKGCRSIVCEVSASSMAPGDRLLKLAELADRLRGLDVELCVGSSWQLLQGAKGTRQVDEDALKARFIGDLLVGMDGPGSKRAAFIGEIRITPALSSDALAAVIGAAAQAHRGVRDEKGTGGPPVMVSFDLGEDATFDVVLEKAHDVVAQFSSVAPLQRPGQLVLVGVVTKMPRIHSGQRELHAGLEEIKGLLRKHKVSLVVDTSDPAGLESIAHIVNDCCAQGLADQLMLSTNVGFKTDLSMYGGHGYAGVDQLVSLLDVREDARRCLLSRNALEALSWFVEPEAPKPKKKPRWKCDGPCGKDFSAKREPFHRLDFQYCSMNCLRAHQAELDAADGKDGKSNGDGGGGRKAGAGSSTGWGITVGT